MVGNGAPGLKSRLRACGPRSRPPPTGPSQSGAWSFHLRFGLGSRRIVHVGVTRHPTDAWVAQQLREATPFDQRPRYLIRDNDAKYGPRFAQLAAASGIAVVRTSIRAPRANAVAERFLGSVRRECLDHLLLIGEAHLRRALGAYVAYFNQDRPHQGLGQRVPRLAEPLRHARHDVSEIVAIPVLGGLHHAYRRAA